MSVFDHAYRESGARKSFTALPPDVRYRLENQEPELNKSS